MSFIMRDRLGPAMSKFNARWALYRRFMRVWQNDGVYFNCCLTYYDGDKVLDYKELNDFLFSIGVSRRELENQKYDKIEEAWFTLNQPEDSPQEFTTQDAIDYMEPDSILEIGDEIEVTFQYNGQLKTRVPEDTYQYIESIYHSGADTQYNVHLPFSTLQVRDKIMSDPGSYILSQAQKNDNNNLNKYYSTASVPNEMLYKEERLSYGNQPRSPYDDRYKYQKPACIISTNSRYGWYAVFDDNHTNFEEISVGEPNGNIDDFTWIVKYKVIKKLEPTDACIVKFIDYYNSFVSGANYDGKMRKEASLPIRVTNEDYLKKYPLQNDELWVDGKLTVYGVSKLKKKDFAELIPKILDTDFEEEEDKESWWEKLLAITIIVVSVVLAVFTYGASETMMMPLRWAMAFGIAALSLTVGGALLAAVAGPSATKYVRTIGAFAQFSSIISSILSIVGGVGSFFKSFSSETIMETAKQKAAKATTTVAKEAIMTEATELSSSSWFKRMISVTFDNMFSSLSFGGDSIIEPTNKLISAGDNVFSVYNNYRKNAESKTLKETINEKEEELKNLEEQNEKNAPHKVGDMGEIVMQPCMGSYDALACLDVDMELLQQGIHETDNMDLIT